MIDRTGAGLGLREEILVGEGLYRHSEATLRRLHRVQIGMV